MKFIRKVTMPEIGFGALRRTRAMKSPSTMAIALPTMVTRSVTFTKAISMSGSDAHT